MKKLGEFENDTFFHLQWAQNYFGVEEKSGGP
jgi:hypothetical protein